MRAESRVGGGARYAYKHLHLRDFMTTHFVVGCPDASEHSPYFGRYISLVSDPDILTVLESQWKETAALLRGLNEKDGPHRYAPDKWTVREVLGHMNDTERIFAYRALRIARADKTPLRVVHVPQHFAH